MLIGVANKDGDCKQEEEAKKSPSSSAVAKEVSIECHNQKQEKVEYKEQRAVKKAQEGERAKETRLVSFFSRNRIESPTSYCWRQNNNKGKKREEEEARGAQWNHHHSTSTTSSFSSSPSSCRCLSSSSSSSFQETQTDRLEPAMMAQSAANSSTTNQSMAVRDVNNNNNRQREPLIEEAEIVCRTAAANEQSSIEGNDNKSINGHQRQQKQKRRWSLDRMTAATATTMRTRPHFKESLVGHKMGSTEVAASEEEQKIEYKSDGGGSEIEEANSTKRSKSIDGDNHELTNAHRRRLESCAKTNNNDPLPPLTSTTINSLDSHNQANDELLESIDSEQRRRRQDPKNQTKHHFDEDHQHTTTTASSITMLVSTDSRIESKCRKNDLNNRMSKKRKVADHDNQDVIHLEDHNKKMAQVVVNTNYSRKEFFHSSNSESSTSDTRTTAINNISQLHHKVRTKDNSPIIIDNSRLSVCSTISRTKFDLKRFSAYLSRPKSSVAFMKQLSNIAIIYIIFTSAITSTTLATTTNNVQQIHSNSNNNNNNFWPIALAGDSMMGDDDASAHVDAGMAAYNDDVHDENDNNRNKNVLTTTTQRRRFLLSPSDFSDYKRHMLGHLQQSAAASAASAAAIAATASAALARRGQNRQDQLMIGQQYKNFSSIVPYSIVQDSDYSSPNQEDQLINELPVTNEFNDMMMMSQAQPSAASSSDRQQQQQRHYQNDLRIINVINENNSGASSDANRDMNEHQFQQQQQQQQSSDASKITQHIDTGAHHLHHHQQPQTLNQDQNNKHASDRALLPLDSTRLMLPQMQQIKSRFNQGCVGGTKCQFFAFCWMSGGSLGASCGLLMTCCVTPSRQEIQPGFYGPVVNDPYCGRSTSKINRIVGGTDASFGQFPWQAFVQVGGSRCGGALISSRHVVTAGHCVARSQHSPSSIKVTLGDYILNSDIESIPHEVFSVVEVLLHPNFRFTPQADRYDVAVLELDRTASYKDNIKPICLPQKDATFVGRVAYVAGWGALQAGSKLRPKVLQHVAVPVIENHVCESWHRRKGIDIRIYDEMMCAGYELGQRDACQGDSGGPLMLNQFGVWYLVGIVSAGYSCAKQYQPGIYHRVSSSSDWISSNVYQQGSSK